MAEEPPKDLDEGLQRFLRDLRSGAERRSWDERRRRERRSGEKDVDLDRRAPRDRRDRFDRRIMLLDRRRGRSDSYIREHAERIRNMLLDPSAQVVCPKCGGDLLLGPSVTRAGSIAREVHCTACRRSILIANLPEETEGGEQPG